MTDEARARLETMVRTANGFEIAETDLLLRGPGEFFGTRQSGDLGFHIANPIRDKDLLEVARREAFALAEDAQQSPALQRLLRQLPGEWQRRYHLRENWLSCANAAFAHLLVSCRIRQPSLFPQGFADRNVCNRCVDALSAFHTKRFGVEEA